VSSGICGSQAGISIRHFDNRLLVHSLLLLQLHTRSLTKSRYLITARS